MKYQKTGIKDVLFSFHLLKKKKKSFSGQKLESFK